MDAYIIAVRFCAKMSYSLFFIFNDITQPEHNLRENLLWQKL